MLRSALYILLVTLLLSGATPAQEDKSGKQLFQQHCQTCHGPQGRGDGPAAQVLPTPPRDLSRRPYRFGCGPGAVARTVRSGISESGMPAFSALLSDEEIWQIAHYVRTLQAGCGGCR